MGVARVGAVWGASGEGSVGVGMVMVVLGGYEGVGGMAVVVVRAVRGWRWW